MRSLIHATLAAALIISDAAQAASLSGAGSGNRRETAAIAADDARYQRSEAAWKNIMASVCVGCGAPPPPLEIVRTSPQTTRPERQAELGVPVAPASLREPASSAPPAQAGAAKHPAVVVRKRVPRVAHRHLRAAARMRARIQLVRLQRLRERRRLALLRRRQEARRALRLIQAMPLDLSGRAIEPVSPGSLIVAPRSSRHGRPIGALASVAPSLSVPALPPSRDCPRRREAVLVERLRTQPCSDDDR